MTMIKLGLVDRDDKLTGAPYDDELKTLLLSAAPIYRKYWWPTHDAGNRAWIEDAVRRTTKYAPAIVARLTTLYGVPWFGRPVRVDVVRFGKSQGAYTSNNPTHIVVASSDPGYAQCSSRWSRVSSPRSRDDAEDHHLSEAHVHDLPPGLQRVEGERRRF